jgi:magnesium chelatase family protein
MLASRLPGILPPLTEQEALDTARVASVSQAGLDIRRWRIRSFRAPHHTASSAALVGGGSKPRPGEVSLAHHGVLFLDELPEFNRNVLEVLREPLESGRIVIARAASHAEFPARFQLVAAMNPCPCGYHGDRSGRCNCSADQVQRYRGRISGPLLDRIDLHVEVARPDRIPQAHSGPTPENSAAVRRRVVDARQIQLERGGVPNAQLGSGAVKKYCGLDAEQRGFLEAAAESMGLSPRACQRILKVSRTLADLDGADEIRGEHLAEAIAYRGIDCGIGQG